MLTASGALDAMGIIQSIGKMHKISVAPFMVAFRRIATLPDVQPKIILPLKTGGLDALLAETERLHIVAALEASGGIVAEAGRLLGLKRTTLIDKMVKYSLKER